MQWLARCWFALVLTSCAAGLAHAELTAYWSFNDGNGDLLTDDTGRGNDGALMGTVMPSWSAGHSSAAGDTSLYFSGGPASTASRVLLGDRADLEPIGNQTLSMWVNPDLLNVRMDPYGKAYGGSGTLAQWENGTVYYLCGDTGANSGTYHSSTVGAAYDYINSGTALQANTWQHIASVRDLDSGVMRFYINGVETATKTAFFDSPGGSRPIVSGSLPAYIGRGYNATGYTGHIDDAAMWNEALSLFQIKLLASGAVSPLELSEGREDWLPGWRQRQEITIQSTGADLNDFPALIKLTDGANDVFARAQSSEGYDIVFTTADGRTLLAHDLENFRSTSGSEDLTAWVKTSLSATEDTTIYMYYNGPDLGDLSSTDTWNDNYKVVQHLQEDPSDAAPQMKDSTANGNHGTAAGGVAHADSGPIDGAAAFDYNSTISIANSSSLNATDYTIEMWVHTNSTRDSYPTLLNRDGQSGEDGFFWIYARRASPERLEFQYADGAAYRMETFADALNMDEWSHVVFTFDDATKLLSLYINGTLFDTRTLTGALPVDDGTLYLGAYAGRIGDDTYGFEGLLDEFRFSSMAYDADWIAATYQFMTESGALLTFGAPEAVPEPSALLLLALATVAVLCRRSR